MGLFRRLIVRQIVTVIFLLMGLFTHAQEIFSCQLMDNQPQFSCCCLQSDDGCEMGGGCEVHKDHNHNRVNCCEISVVDLPNFQAPSFISPHLLITSLDGPQPPPGILPLIPSNIVLPSQRFTYLQPFSLPPWLLGTHIYLLTHRLRN